MLFHGKQFDRELQEEMRLHMELRGEEHLAAAAFRKRAARALPRDAGSAIRPCCRRLVAAAARGWRSLEHLAR